MCHFVSYIMEFQKIIVYKTPPGGGGGSIASSRSKCSFLFTFLDGKALSKGSTIKGKNMLLQKQVLSFKSLPPIQKGN